MFVCVRELTHARTHRIRWAPFSIVLYGMHRYWLHGILPFTRSNFIFKVECFVRSVGRSVVGADFMFCLLPFLFLQLPLNSVLSVCAPFCSMPVRLLNLIPILCTHFLFFISLSLTLSLVGFFSFSCVSWLLAFDSVTFCLPFNTSVIVRRVSTHSLCVYEGEGESTVSLLFPFF